MLVSKSHSEKYFDNLNKTLIEPLNETLVHLVAAESVAECGKPAADSEDDFPGERRNCGDVAWEYSPHEFAAADLTAAADDFAVAAFCAAAPVVDDPDGGGAAAAAVLV